MMINVIKNFLAWQPTKFIISGGSAAVVNLGTAYFLTDILEWWYLAASIMAFILSLVVSFSLQKFWTFNNYHLNQWHSQFAVYIVLAVLNLSVNTLLVFIGVEWFKVWYLTAQFITGGLIGIYTFFIYRFLFHHHE
ncbi:MAG: GtrA family protein [bacterium]|nr:GtrA family protein [bacterium]